MFAPDGSIKDVPDSQTQSALAAGGKFAIPMMKGGDSRLVPHDQVGKAMQAGATVVNDNQGVTTWHAFKSLIPGAADLFHATGLPANSEEAGKMMAQDQQKSFGQRLADVSPLSALKAAASVPVSMAKETGRGVKGVFTGDPTAGLHLASGMNPFAAPVVSSMTEQGLGTPEANATGALGAGTLAAGLTASKIGQALPSRANAGAALEEVKSAAGNIPINTTAPGNTALQLYEQAQKGAYVPRAVTRLTQRLSSPEAPPMTYSEAKDFQSIISRLSADDYNRMAPPTKFLVGKLNADLKGSLADAADVAGKGQQFTQAMQEYHRAMQVRGFTDEARAMALKATIYGALGTAAGGVGYKVAKMLGF